MTRQTITANFRDGTTADRSTAAHYTHASRKHIGTQAGRGATVRLHVSEAQARAAAGSRGEVAATDYVAAAASTSGTTVTCYCGKTVVAFNGQPTGATCPRECSR